MTSKKIKFLKETDLCREFENLVDKTVWTIYNETCNYDIMLVRKSDGYQVGVEAKLKANLKVIYQAASNFLYYNSSDSGPDAVAVLIPSYENNAEFSTILKTLGINLLTVGFRSHYKTKLIDNHYESLETFTYFMNDKLPSDNDYNQWNEMNFRNRCELPDYVPDVIAGDSSPIKLTKWKISALKILAILEARGYVYKEDFHNLAISPQMWMASSNWLSPGPIKGQWIRSNRTPNFDKEHPTIYEQVKADYIKWYVPLRSEEIKKGP